MSAGILTIFMILQMDHVGSSVCRVPFCLCNLQLGARTWPIFHLHISTGYNISHCWHWFLRNLQLIANDPAKETIHYIHDVAALFIGHTFWCNNLISVSWILSRQRVPAFFRTGSHAVVTSTYLQCNSHVTTFHCSISLHTFTGIVLSAPFWNMNEFLFFFLVPLRPCLVLEF
jgi:hypothetical protein